MTPASVRSHLANEAGVGGVSALLRGIPLGSPDVIIGVFDNGFDMEHPDYCLTWWAGRCSQRG